MCARYIPDGYKSKKVGAWWGGGEGGTPTLSLCLAWISILCGINRCFKAKKKKVLTFFLDILTDSHCRIEGGGALCGVFFLFLFDVSCTVGRGASAGAQGSHY